ncbi:MAG TPA: cell division protein ZapC, partial [Alistipes obesi]|nr:cell division protein ZapC [Alistipes communis]
RRPVRRRRRRRRRRPPHRRCARYVRRRTTGRAGSSPARDSRPATGRRPDGPMPRAPGRRVR